MKRLISATTAIFGVVLGILTPFALDSATANAAGPTVTRVIQVVDSNQAKVAGASVAIYLDDYAVPLNGHMSAVITTDSQGIATFQLPSGISSNELLVQPETASGLATSDDGSINLDPNLAIDTVTVILRPATYFLSVKNPDGTTAADSGTIIISPLRINPNNGRTQRDFIRVVNPNKPVGIAYDATTLAFGTQKLKLTVSPKYDMDCKGLATNNYLLTVNAQDSITAINPSVPGDNAVQSGKTFSIKLGTPNLSGTLQATGGGALNLAPESSAQMYLYSMTDPSTPSPIQSWQQPACVNPDGTWSTRVFNISGTTPEYYRIAFSVQDSNTTNSALPTFISDSLLTVDTSNNLSINGAAAPSLAGVNIASPTKSLTLHFSDNGATSLGGVFIQSMDANSNYIPFANVTTASGYVSLYLPTGSYIANFTDFSGHYRALPVQIGVKGGVFVNSGGPISASGNPLNTFEIPLSHPNFNFRVEDDSNAPVTNAYINAGPSSGIGNWFNSVTSSSPTDGTGSGSISLAPGVLTMININLNFASGLAAARYWATISDTGSVTIVSDDGFPVVYDQTKSQYVLKAHTGNLLTLVTDPLSGLPISGQSGTYIQICSNTSCFGSGIDNSGFSNFYLADGSYTIRVGQNGSAYAEASYAISVLGGVVSFTGTTPAMSGNRYVLSPVIGNFRAQLVSPIDTTTALTGSWLEICTLDSFGNITSGIGRGTDNLGRVTLNLADGSYLLKVHPNNNSGFAVSSFKVTVSGSNIVVTGASQSGQVWLLPASQPNLSGTVSLATGPITYGTNQSISFQVQKWNGNNWDWTNQNSYTTTSNYALNVTRDPSDVAPFVKYRLQVTPNGFPDLAQIYSDSFFIGSNGKISLTESVDSQTSAITNFNLIIQDANLKFDVQNPIDSTPLNFGWLNIETLNNDSSTVWYGNVGLNPSAPGKVSINLPTGVGINQRYFITVNPPNGSQAIAGLAARRYIATVSGDSITVTTYAGGAVNSLNGRYVVSPAKANVTGTLFTKANTVVGSDQFGWAWVGVEQWSTVFNNWNGTSFGTNTSATGSFSLSITDPGKYRLRLETYGRVDTALTYSDSFTIVSDTDQVSFSHLTLNSPSILLKLVYPDDTATPLTNYGVEIRQNNQFIGWANSNGGSTVPIALPSPGVYQITVNPPWNNARSGFSKKTYEVVATGSPVTGSVTGATANGAGVFTLTLANATFAGRVFTPSDTQTGVANAQVVPVDLTTGREYWEYSTNTNQNGAFSISVPDGTYSLVAKAPWGTSQYGSSLPSSSFVVSGGSTANGSAISLSLRAPKWSGTLKSPDGSSTISFASVCFQANVSTPWTCTNTDLNGRWALSEPYGFNLTGFDDNSILEVRENNNAQYSPVRYQGAAALTNILGAGSNTIELRLNAPNTQITVLAGGQPVANAWVNLDRDNYGWLGGSSTDANGVARFNIDLSGGAFNLNADISNTSYVGAFTASRTTFSDANVTAGTSGGIFRGTLNLVTPNLKGVLTDPQDGNKAVPYTWVELFNESTNQWMGGANTDSTGFFTMNIPNAASGTDTYTVNVNPQWNSTSSSSRQAYSAAIGTTGAPVVTLKKDGSSLSTTSRPGVTGAVYNFQLATPSVTGVVRDANGNPLMNSWVVPIDSTTGEYLWQLGTNSRSNGSFSLALTNGSYQLEANVPWGTSGQARSARCDVSVAFDAMGSSGCSESGTATLRLRSPNLTITLTSPTGQPVFNANIGIGYQSWNTWAQSSRDGKVSFFIDPLAIEQSTGTKTGQLHLWIDPPYGTSEMVRIDCNSGVGDPTCSGIPSLNGENTYTATTASIQFTAPNTKVRVLDPDGTPVTAGAWVAVFNQSPEGWRQWVAGSNTDSNGYAAFNIDTATNTNLVVEVNPPYNKRDLYSTKTYDSSTVMSDGASFGSGGINGRAFKLQAPNLKITSKTPGGAAINKWGWISIEESVTGTSYYNWVGGYGLDDFGRISVTLAANKTFRIAVNPGPGKSGSRTTCLFTTDESATVSVLECGSINETPSIANSALLVTLNMDEGNVVGTVYSSDSTTVLAGALVYANLMLGDGSISTDPATKVSTISGANGRYGLNLDFSNNQVWGIRVVPLSNPSLAVTLFTNISSPPGVDYNLVVAAK